eukprot:jgi/Hompol1/165/HPOL_001281-RA
MALEWLHALAVVATAALAIFISTLLILSPRPRPATTKERQFRDALTGATKQFPSLVERDTGSDTSGSSQGGSQGSASATQMTITPAEVTLSVVVPAYCEQDRLPAMIHETVEYLDDRLEASFGKFSYEIIVVDDGSKDKTTEVALDLAKSHMRKKLQLGNAEIMNTKREMRVMTLTKNRGKGGAVAQGVLAARGELILFVDADGASKFADIEKLEEKIYELKNASLGIAIGSRAHMVNSQAVVQVTRNRRSASSLPI